MWWTFLSSRSRRQLIKHIYHNFSYLSGTRHGAKMANDQPPRKPRPPLASTTLTASPSSRCSTEADSVSTGGKRTPHNPKTPDPKHSNRVLKRPSAARAATDSRAVETQRYKRVWKACERCRVSQKPYPIQSFLSDY